MRGIYLKMIGTGVVDVVKGKSLFWLLAVMLLMVPVLAACGGTTTAPPATTSPAAPSVEVYIRDFAISLPTITVPVGTTVTWTNLAYDVHIITSDTGLFGSGALGPPEGGLLSPSFSYTFTERGTFSYHCSLHPYLIGTVIVE